MKKLKGYLLSAALFTGAASFVWFRLLDERARANVKATAAKTGQVANHLVATYMNPEGSAEANDEAAKKNREWIDWQWRQAGF